MKLKVIGSGSKGNAYLLYNEQEALLIECGVNIKEIKKALDFNLSKVAGCLVSHEHGDHAKSIKEVMAAGIDVYATEGTHTACNTLINHRSKVLRSMITVGGFKISAFDIRHDAAEPCGFLINHPECGNTLFLTDTFYCPYTFKNLHNIIVECNFSEKIIRERLAEMEFLKNRIFQSHMSLETCKEFLKANDLSQTNNIVLIHLSDGNSDEAYFKSEITQLTGKTVTVADKGLEINLDKTPF